jgi:hypothetical protein
VAAQVVALAASQALAAQAYRVKGTRAAQAPAHQKQAQVVAAPLALVLLAVAPAQGQ